MGDENRDGLGCFEVEVGFFDLFVLVVDRPFALVALEVLGRGGEKAGRLRFAVAEADVAGMSIVIWNGMVERRLQKVQAGDGTTHASSHLALNLEIFSFSRAIT